MNATATHDTKRGEDARARINVLSELPDEWERHLKILEQNQPARKKTKVRGAEAPDRNDEYFLYQTLIGSYPLDRDARWAISRATQGAILIKAVREAKVHTEWLKPDWRLRRSICQFCRGRSSRRSEDNRFIAEFLPFVKKIAHCGMFNSLGQTLLKMAAPGVPDIYQGTELWDLSFVDPDNRRPVDYAERRQLLERAQEMPSRRIASAC